MLKDAGLLGLLRLVPWRLNRFTVVPGSKAASVLDVVYLVRSCETGSWQAVLVCIGCYLSA